MVSKKLHRLAFTMIELIFAIVIIGIAVLSLPMMTQATSRGVESNILQEAIFAASAELMGAASFYWDRNSMQDSAFSHLSRVIDVGFTCNNNNNSSRFRLRDGHIPQPLHRRCLDSNTTGLADAPATDFPNLNNAVHGSQEIFLLPSPEASGYKDSYFSTVGIEKVDETGAANNNVKKITVTVSNAGGTITVLRIYSANIGEIDYYKRRF